jgi:hypothetical protein
VKYFPICEFSNLKKKNHTGHCGFTLYLIFVHVLV